MPIAPGDSGMAPGAVAPPAADLSHWDHAVTALGNCREGKDGKEAAAQLTSAERTRAQSDGFSTEMGN